MTQHIVIYVPGLGDKSINARRRLFGLWRYKDIDIEVFVPNWQTDESWQIKLNRLLARIDQLHTDGKIVSLVGESAGASAVTQALKLRAEVLNAVVLLCGKSRYPERVAAWRYQQNPALREAITLSHIAVRKLSTYQKQKILNLHPMYDPIMPVQETKIPGIKNALIPTVGHATSIVFSMTFWSWRIVRFVRLRARAG